MKKNMNIDAMMLQFKYASGIDADLKKSLTHHMEVAQRTLDARKNGGSATMSEDEVDRGTKDFERIYNILWIQQRSACNDILSALEGMTISEVREHNLWGLAISRNVGENMDILLKISHQPYHEDDSMMLTIIGASAEKLRGITEKLDALRRLQDIYEDAAMK